MKGTSKVIMGATLVMVVSLAVVLGLILVLLAELYCSLLLRRRHLRNSSTTTTISTTTATPQTTMATAFSYSPSQCAPPPPPLFNNNVYAPGVLQAPRSFLFPSLACMEEPNANANASPSPRRIGLVSLPSPLASFMNRAPPKQVQEDPLQGRASETLSCADNKSHNCSVGEHHLVYISNPIYENEEGKLSAETIVNTPFETPDTSPSRLERSYDSSGDDDDVDVVVVGAIASPPYTPHLTPTKKLTEEACSVSLIRDARSLGTSASDHSRSNNCLSSSSSGSPCTSPSW